LGVVVFFQEKGFPPKGVCPFTNSASAGIWIFVRMQTAHKTDVGQTYNWR